MKGCSGSNTEVPVAGTGCKHSALVNMHTLYADCSTGVGQVVDALKWLSSLGAVSEKALYFATSQLKALSHA